MNLLEHMKFKMLMRNQLKVKIGCSKTKNQSKFSNYFFQTGKKINPACLKDITETTEINYIMPEKYKNYVIYLCIQKYTYDYTLIVDKQLVLCKSRCQFITYNKLDKYSIKFWALVNVKMKYVSNIVLYFAAQKKNNVTIYYWQSQW